MLTAAGSDYSGDVLWSDQRFGGDLDFLLGLGVPLEINTNGVYLTGEVAKRLMSSRVVFLNVSLDAARDATFRRVRKGAPPLDQIVTNMKRVVEERRIAGRSDLRLSLSFALMRSNIVELCEFISLGHEVGFDLVIARHVEAYTASMAHESLWWDQEGFNKARDEAIRFAESVGIELAIPRPFEPRPKRPGHELCHEPWTGAMILGNGDVHVCCVPGPGMRMGNLHEQSMEQIWNGAAYQRFRTRVNSADPPPACQACPMRRKYNNPDSYMPYLINSDLPVQDTGDDASLRGEP